jgi:hypothetical protein
MSETIDKLTLGNWVEIYEILDCSDGHLNKAGKKQLEAMKLQLNDKRRMNK